MLHSICFDCSAIYFSVPLLVFTTALPCYRFVQLPTNIAIGFLEAFPAFHTYTALDKSDTNLEIRTSTTHERQSERQIGQKEAEKRAWHTTYEEKSPKNQNPISQKPADQTPTSMQVLLPICCPPVYLHHKALEVLRPRPYSSTDLQVFV